MSSIDSNGQLGTASSSRRFKKEIKEHRKVQELGKGMEVLTAQLKAQAAQIQKVSAQLEVSRSAPQTVLNNQ